MTTLPPLPTDGQTAWGDPLNAYLSALTSEANTTQTNLTNHAANSPSDPHGDRAYASSLIGPLLANTNQPNGLVKLNSSGVIPANLIYSSSTGGIFYSVYDCVDMFGAVAGTNTDQSTAIQNALTAAGNNGGGLVWLGPGTYSIANYLVMPNNVVLMMSPSTTLQRIQGSGTPAYMITNVKFGTSNTPATNLRIIGGKLDAIGSQSLTAVCTGIFLIQANGTKVEGTQFNMPYNTTGGMKPAIEVNGSHDVWIQNCAFEGTSPVSGVSNVPAVRVNSSSTSTTPSGLAGGVYNNAVCTNVNLVSCVLGTANASGTYGYLVGTDLFYSTYYHDYISAVGCVMEYAGDAGQVLPYNWNHYNTNNNLYEGNPYKQPYVVNDASDNQASGTSFAKISKVWPAILEDQTKGGVWRLTVCGIGLWGTSGSGTLTFGVNVLNSGTQSGNAIGAAAFGGGTNFTFEVTYYIQIFNFLAGDAQISIKGVLSNNTGVNHLDTNSVVFNDYLALSGISMTVNSNITAQASWGNTGGSPYITGFGSCLEYLGTM